MNVLAHLRTLRDIVPSGDTVCHDLTPGLIKIDIEGAELLALRGGVATQERTCPILVIAVHPEPMRLLGTTPAELVTFLTERGYEARSLAGASACDPRFDDLVATPVDGCQC